MIGLKKSLYDYTSVHELNKVMEWFRHNQLLVNVDKTGSLFLGPHPNKVYVKCELDMADLHNVAPQYLFLADDPDDPDHHTVNKKGEFVLHELHKICPKHFISEYIETVNGSLFCENESVKYLGIQFDSRLKFKKQTAIVTCKVVIIILY